jgi:hypothetical protein
MQKFLFFLAVIPASAWLIWLFDDGLGFGWETNVLHNWQQYGLATLGGALVQNNGGFEVVSHPDVYPGMSPLYLYPVYFCTQIFGWTGLGTLSFHILFAAVVFGSVWFILGKDFLAMLVAALVVLTPGYGSSQKVLDPNATAVLYGIPYTAIILYFLKRPQLGARQFAALTLATALFVPMNWTTAWFLLPFGVFILVNPEVSRRRALAFLAFTALGCVLFVIGSVLLKFSGTHSLKDGVTPARVLGGYTWGNYGYYDGLSTFHAFLRVFVTNMAGLLPLLVWWAWRTLLTILRAPRQGWICVLPVPAALANIIIMRNYSCHHPWMNAPVIIAGLLLSLALQKTDAEKDRSFARNLVWPAVLTACAFLYGLVILTIYRSNNLETIALAHLVRDNIPRAQSVVVLKSSDPLSTALAEQLSPLMDRHFIVTQTLDELPAVEPFKILSTVAITNFQLVAEADLNPPSDAAGLGGKIANWYNHNVGRRKSGDRIDFPPHFYIYRPPSNISPRKELRLLP